MPDGSPIDQWWKSHLPAKVTTNPKLAVHAPRSPADPRPYCGHRDRAAMIVGAGGVIDCSACLAALRADDAQPTGLSRSTPVRVFGAQPEHDVSRHDAAQIAQHDRDIAARVHEAMRAAGMTQRDIVNYMQIAPDKLSKSLRGKRRLSSLEVALIAEATGTSTDKLLGIQIDVTGYRAGWVDGWKAALEEVRLASHGTVSVADLIDQPFPGPEPSDPEPQPGDGPDYPAEWAYWKARQPPTTEPTE